MVFNNNLLLGAAGAGGDYTIDQSIRFNDNDTAYLNNTTYSGSPTSGTDCTFSFWVKRCNLSTTQCLFFGGNPAGSTWEIIRFESDDQFRVGQASSAYDLTTSQVFRDVGAWSHFVVAFDTDNSAAAERIRIYHNGSRITDFSLETNPSSGYVTNFNTGGAGEFIRIGYQGGGSNPSDVYLAEINFVDGQALDPTSFGEVNADTGQWVPIEYTGSYGTNGFYITGADSADLGADDSGNGNDFTSSGLAAADQMLDTPTDNYATMNSIGSGLRTAGSMADGNLKVTTGTTIEGEWYFGTQRLQGNVYWEVYINSIGNSRLYCGVGIDGDDYAHVKDDHWVIYSFNGTFYNQGSAGKTSSAISATSTLQFAFSEDNDALWVGVDGTWLYSATQAEIEAFTTTNKANSTSFGGIDLFPVVGTGSSTNVVTYNFGQTAFTYTKPTGYSAISTASLDDPSIALPEKYFNTVLYEGNGGGQRVGQFQPITETYTVPNSVIINNADSAYLEKTFSTSESTLTAWSFSAWVKRSLLADEQFIFQAGTTSANLEYLRFTNSDTLEYKLLLSSSLDANYITDQVFKDTSSWMHIYAYRSSTTFKLYINGTEVTEFSTSNAPGSSDGMFGKNVRHRISGDYSSTPGNLFSGYLAEVNFIPGTAEAVSDFGQLDASTNKWIPKAYSGSYGTNGFYLDMETAPGTGSGAGTDSSGNGNNFTESGLAASDQVTDSPTDNQSVLDANRIDAYTLSQGNLFTNAVGDAAAIGTIAFDPQDEEGFYFEAKVTTAATYPNVGIRTLADIPTGSGMSGNTTGRYAYTGSNGQFNAEGTGVSYGDVWAGTADKVIGVYIKAGELFFSVDGTIQNSGTAAITGLTGLMVPTVFYNAASGTHASWEMRFNSSDWSTTPSGYKSISTDNLPLSNGDLSAFVWIKNRDATDNHMLFDAVRGATKDLHPDITSAEVTNANTLTRFLKNGFEVSNDVQVNTSGESYVAWQWMNDSLTTSSNTDGSITSTVLANTTSGVSILSSTGTGSNGTIGHGLGVAPKMIIGKTRDSAVENWGVYHEKVGPTKALYLNGTSGPVTASTFWQNTAPTSSVFSIGSSATTNSSGDAYIWYCFAEVEGFSKFGGYTGNGSTDGPFIFTGMTPEFVIIKRTNTTQNWVVLDNARSKYNVTDDVLFPDLSNAETANSTTIRVDNVSNGFKVRGTDVKINGSGSTYVYMAFAKSPFKTATAR